MEKTVQQMEAAIFAYCDEVCPKFQDSHAIEGIVTLYREHSGIRVYNFDTNTMIFTNGKSNREGSIRYHYRLLGLAERDAVAKEREIAEEYLSRLKAERARNTALLAALDVLANHISNTQFMYKLYLESKDGTNSFNLSKSIGELGRAKTKCKKEFLDASSTEQGDQSND